MLYIVQPAIQYDLFNHKPLEPNQGQFENVDNMYHHNHQNRNKSTICMRISRNLEDPVPMFLMDLWLMYQTK